VSSRLLAALAATTILVATNPAAAASPPTPPPTTAAPATTVPAPTTSGPVPPGLPPADAWILVDGTTGRVVAQDDDHQPVLPASLSKMFTGLVASGWLPPSATLTASAGDTTVEPNRIGMLPGQQWPLNEVLQALMLISANDAAFAIAEAVAGSPQAFGPVVQKAMTEMGITDHPQFNDPAGFDDTTAVGGGNLICARDLAIAARAVLADPVLGPIVQERKLAFTGPQGTQYGLENVNDFFMNSYPGALGVKTGLTDRSGFSVAEAAYQKGRVMIAVVLHGANSPQTATMLLDEGFATPASAESPVDALPPVVLPKPQQAAPPTSTTTAPPARALSAAPDPSGAAGGGISSSTIGGAAGAAALLLVVGLLAGRLLRRSRPAHGRRRP
jgi:D-alanyl-D-alanine carboxypeptidase (penicillin-binding protein 5/6)